MTATEGLWTDATSTLAGAARLFAAHNVTACPDCDAHAETWRRAHAAWWTGRSGPRPTLSPFCDAANRRAA